MALTSRAQLPLDMILDQVAQLSISTEGCLNALERLQL